MINVQKDVRKKLGFAESILELYQEYFLLSKSFIKLIDIFPQPLALLAVMIKAPKRIVHPLLHYTIFVQT